MSIGGCLPLVFSLLGDLFPVSQRSAVASVVQIALGLGLGGGQMLAVRCRRRSNCCCVFPLSLQNKINLLCFPAAVAEERSI